MKNQGKVIIVNKKFIKKNEEFLEKACSKHARQVNGWKSFLKAIKVEK